MKHSEVKKRNFKRESSSLLKHLMFILLSLVTLFPVYFIFVSAFKSKIEFITNKISIPIQFTIENFIIAFRGKTFLIWTINTIILTFGAVIFSVFASVLASYAFAKIRFPGSKRVLEFVVSLMLVSPIVIIVPLFVLFAEIKLINSYLGLILIYSGLVLPFSIYLLTSFFKTIPNSLIESAEIDGCSKIGIIFRIVVPISTAPIITLVVINALYVWSEFIFALTFLQSDKMKTLMIGITIFQSRYNVNTPVIMAGMTLATIPMILLYMFGQKFFIRGVIAGALKE